MHYDVLYICVCVCVCVCTEKSLKRAATTTAATHNEAVRVPASATDISSLAARKDLSTKERERLYQQVGHDFETSVVLTRLMLEQWPVSYTHLTLPTILRV